MWRKATPVGGCTPGWSTVGARVARGTGGATLGPCPPPGPAPFLRALRRSPLPVCHGSPGCARLPPLGPCGGPGRRPPGCSRCRGRSHPESRPAPACSAGRRVRPRAPPRAALRHGGRVKGVAWGTSLLRCSGPVCMRGRGRAHCTPAAQVPRACCPRQAPGYLKVGVRARILLWGVSFAASESQLPDDLVHRVQRQRSGACFAWGRGFRHCCVAGPKSRGWGADFPWLPHVLWARWGLSGLAQRAGVGAVVWALGAPPAARVARVTPLRGVLLSPAALLRLPWSATRCCRVCVCGGPALSPRLACPVWAACRGGGGGPSPGGAACHHCEGHLVSGAVHLRAARSPERAAGVPRPVCPGCGWHGRWGPAPAPPRVPLWPGSARCGGGGGASAGGVPFAVVRGV